MKGQIINQNELFYRISGHFLELANFNILHPYLNTINYLPTYYSASKNLSEKFLY